MPIVKEETSLQIKEVEALTTLANSVKEISTFLNGGGLANILSGYARSQAVKDILGGLATHDGRQALDARLLDQNALDIVTQVEKVFEKYQSKLQEKGKEDPEIYNAENEYIKWARRNSKR